MPALPKPQKEVFAQRLAAGATQEEAYRAAGYKGRDARSGGSKMARDEWVRARVAELRSEQLGRKAPELVPVSEINLPWLQKQAQNIMQAAFDDKDYGAASQTLERIAKISGLWLERQSSETNQVVRVYSGEPLTEEEWEAKWGKGVGNRE